MKLKEFTKEFEEIRRQMANAPLVEWKNDIEIIPQTNKQMKNTNGYDYVELTLNDNSVNVESLLITPQGSGHYKIVLDLANGEGQLHGVSTDSEFYDQWTSEEAEEVSQSDYEHVIGRISEGFVAGKVGYYLIS